MKLNFLNRSFGFVLVFILVVSTASCANFKTHRVAESSDDLQNPTQSWYSHPLERLGDGFANIVYGPLELIYQFKEEIKRTDPVRGLLPGVLKGVTWFGVREVVGVFEMVTFFLPLEPHLDPFDTTWLHL